LYGCWCRTGHDPYPYGAGSDAPERNQAAVAHCRDLGYFTPASCCFYINRHTIDALSERQMLAQFDRD
jgi:hypothetical protein